MHIEESENMREKKKACRNDAHSTGEDFITLRFLLEMA
jgi:hypothetical protein